MRRMGLINQIMTVALAIAVLLGSGAAASATVISGDSNAYNASIGLSTLGVDVISTQIPNPATSVGVPPPPNSNSNGLNHTTNYNLVESLATLGLKVDALSTFATSNVDGTSGPKLAMASQSITNLVAGLSTGLGLLSANFITATATATNANLISSYAMVSGDYGAFDTSGGSYILGADLNTILGQPIDLTGHLDINGYAKPNTTINLNLLGLLGLDGLASVKLVLNEQITDGKIDGVPVPGRVVLDGVSASSMEANVVDLYIRLVGQLVDVDVVIGHSFAELKASPTPAPVPEPSTFMLIGGGLAGLAFWRRRQRK